MARKLENRRRAEKVRGRKECGRAEDTMIAKNSRAQREMNRLRSHGDRGRKSEACGGTQGIGRQNAVLKHLRRHCRQRLCGADSASRAVLRSVQRSLRFNREEECQQAKRESQRSTPAGKPIGKRSRHRGSLPRCVLPSRARRDGTVAGKVTARRGWSARF